MYCVVEIFTKISVLNVLLQSMLVIRLAPQEVIVSHCSIQSVQAGQRDRAAAR